MHGKIEITDGNMEELLKEISGDDDIESTKSKVFYGQERSFDRFRTATGGQSLNDH